MKTNLLFLHGHTHACQLCLPSTILPGGGHSGTQGGRTLVTYFAEEGVFFEDLRMSAIL